MPRREPKPNTNLEAANLAATLAPLVERGNIFIGCWPPEAIGVRVNHRTYPTDDPKGRWKAGEVDLKGGGCWHMVRNLCPCPCHSE